MDLYIEEMIAANIIESGNTVVNAPLFPIWKSKEAGTIRPVYDCRLLNKHIRGKGFSLPDIRYFVMLREPGDLFCKIDLTNAYWHFPIIPSHRKYLGIRWAGRLFRWTVLPFGLRTAPYTFQKALKSLDIYISDTLGLRHLRYLDDLLFMGSHKSLSENVPKVVEMLVDLGFIISPKSVLIPTEKLDFIGYDIEKYKLALKAC